MSIGDVAQTVRWVRDAVKETQSLQEALRDSAAYLAKHHPEAKNDVVAIVVEIRKTMSGLADVSSIVTHFQFVVEGSGVALEPVRFNSYFQASKVKLYDLREKRRSLKGSCTRIEKHGQALLKDPQDWTGLLELFGIRSRKRRLELVATIERLYIYDQGVIYLVEQLLAAVDTALDEVRLAFGSVAAAKPRNVKAAAATLDRQAARFRPLERELLAVAGGLEDVAEELGARA